MPGGASIQQIQVPPSSDHVTISSGISSSPATLSMVRTVTVTKPQIISQHPSVEITTAKLPGSPNRPGILRRRDGERDINVGGK